MTGRLPFAHALFACSIVAACATLGACDDNKPQPATAPSATAVVSAAAEAPPKRTMPQVSIQTRSVSVGMDEIAFNVPSFDSALRDLLKKVPVSEPAVVIVNAERKVPTPRVTSVLYALVDAGAKSLEVRTPPRGGLPDKLVVHTEKDVGTEVLPCSFASMVLDDLGVTFWPVRGGLAKRYSKGMAGPDLSAMHQVLQKEESACRSRLFFISGGDAVEWGHTFDLGASHRSHQPPYNADTIVLLRQVPVAGKKIQLGES